MFVPRAHSTAAGRSTKGGQITMSQPFEFATKGRKAAKNEAVSEGVLYIFQLPAMMGRRTTGSPPRNLFRLRS